MTDRLYLSTSDIERARALWEKGTLLAERTDGFYKLQLFQLHDVYLEVTWHIHFNVAVKVSSFSDTENLEPYLQSISLEGLLA